MPSWNSLVDVSTELSYGSGWRVCFGRGSSRNCHYGKYSVRRFAEIGQRLMSKISSLTIETFAAIDGPCYGGAFGLGLACDLRICSPVLHSVIRAPVGNYYGVGGNTAVAASCWRGKCARDVPYSLTDRRSKSEEYWTCCHRRR